jgi:hypothetical protein
VTQPDIAVVVGTDLARFWHGDQAWLCVAPHDAAGPIGEGSAARVEAGMITSVAGIPRMTGLFQYAANAGLTSSIAARPCIRRTNT